MYVRFKTSFFYVKCVERSKGMKRIILAIFILLLPVISIFAGCDEASNNIEIRISDGYVQWASEDGDNWNNVISIDEIKNMLGQAYKGEKGETGAQGNAGINGREVEFRATDTYIQWHYVNDSNWNNLIAISDLQVIGQEIGDFANPQSLAFYPLDDGTYGVGKGYATQLSKIVIPSTYCGKPVTQIIDQAFAHCKIKEIELPETIVSIGNSAFYFCESLISIEIPNSVTSIGISAFFNCSNLISVTFAENSQLTNIGDSIFFQCSGLTSITIPSSVTSIDSLAFYCCYALAEVYNLSSLSITAGSSDFGCVGYYAKVIHTSASETNRIKIENNIAYYVYNNEKIALTCMDKTLISINISNDCTSINQYAFSNCRSLTSIEIPSSVTSIGYNAFRDCSGLTRVNYLGAIAEWAQISFNSNPLYYAKHLYINGEEVTQITANDLQGVTSIGDYAFYKCSSLTNITIPSSVTSIGNYALYGCSSLTSIEIPISVTSIGNYAFEACSSLTSATFQNPNGWEAGSTTLSSNDLSNTSTAATYLTTTYYNFVWTRS